MRLPALRAALRIARRDAQRSPARSILVVAMIALPILALTTADVLARTAQLSPTEQVDRQMASADAVITWHGGTVEQAPNGREASTGGEEGTPRTPTDAQLLAALPPGAHVISSRAVHAAFDTEAGLKRADLNGFDYSAAPVRGLIRQVIGRAPRTGEEVVLSKPLASSIGMSVGDTVRISRPREQSFRVVGIVEDPYDLRQEVAFTVPAGLPPAPANAEPFDFSANKWYVSTAQPVDWQQVLGLNAKGYLVASREVLLRPPPRSQVPYFRNTSGSALVSVEVVAVAVLAAGMALLEVVLLAGPAFAVGARRRRRELALVTATGGQRRDVRNIVLGGGVVLGLTAAVVGIALGIGLAAATLSPLERLTGSVAGHFDVRPLELGGIALLGVVTGLAAAYLPARSAARQDVVAALAGRRGAVRSSKRLPLIGFGMVLSGTAIALGGAALLHSIPAILVGAVVAEIGLIACTPVLLGLAGKLGSLLPLSPRLALRDAARNRSSATPAVAAIMAAVAGSISIGIVVASQSAHDRASYAPSLAHGDSIVQLHSPAAAAEAPKIAAALRSTLPARQVSIVSAPPCYPNDKQCTIYDVVTPAEQACPADKAQSEAEYERLIKDRRCANRTVTSGMYNSMTLVDDGSALPAMTGVPAREGVAALRAGKVVVFDQRLAKNGTVTIEATATDNGKTSRYEVPGVAITGGFQIARVVVPNSVAGRIGMHPQPIAVHADNRTVPTDREQQAADGALAAMDVGLFVERGYVDSYDLGLLALVIGAGVITLGAAAIATALSNVDNRTDLATLAAVGASPRVRRMLSMSRAGVIAVLGTALGAIAGFAPAIGLILAQRAADQANAVRPFTVSWWSLGFTAVVVPLIAIAIAGLFTRSRLPIERRPAT